MEDSRERLKLRLLGFLNFPGESPEVDYKEAKAFSAKDAFGMKLIRHILGMANAGGGYIVIGYSERNGSLVPDPAMDEAIARSYDATSLSQCVARFTRGDAKPRVLVEKLEHGGLSYPIICVAEFGHSPYFCNSTAPQPPATPIVKEGALYVRDQHTRTVPLADPSQWERLISLCVRKRQSEMLDAFGEIISEVTSGKKPRAEDQTRELARVAQREAQMAREGFAREITPVAAWHCWHTPAESLGPFSSRDLRNAAQAAVRPNTGLPLGLLSVGPNRALPVEDGLRMQYVYAQDRDAEHWFLHQNGGYFICRLLEIWHQAAPIVAWNIRVWRIAEAVDHCIELYRALGCDFRTEIHLQVAHEGLKEVQMGATDGARSVRSEACAIDRVESAWDGSLGALESTRRDVVLGVCTDLFEKFGFATVPMPDLLNTYNEYARSRTK